MVLRIATVVLFLCAKPLLGQFFEHPIPFSEETQMSGMNRGDFDGNGLLDIVYIPAYSPYADFYFQEANGSYTKERMTVGLASPGPFFGKFIQVGDINHDQKDDLVVVHNYTFSCNKLFVYLSEGRTFKTPLIQQIAINYPSALLLQDLDQDHELDILVGFQGGDGNLYGYQGIGNGQFTPFKVPYLNKGTANSLTASDVNHDGLLDLITTRSDEPYIYILQNQGNLSFQQQATLSVDGFAPGNVIAADFNGDQLPEIVATAPGNNPAVTYFINEGNNAFTKTTFILPDNHYATVGMQVMDIHQDGIPDFSVSTSANFGSAAFVVYENAGSHVFNSQIQILKRPGNMVLGMMTSTINSADLSLITSGYEVQTFNIQSLQNIALTATIPLNITPFYGVRLTDLTGDGFDDMVVGNSGSNSISIHINRGDGNFRPSQFIKIKGSARDIQVADINNDGHKDIAYITTANHIHSEGSELGILFGDQHSTFATKAALSDDGTCIAVADFNNDGNQDIVKSQAIYLGTGTGSFSKQSFFSGNLYRILATDIDHDGNQDVIGLTVGLGIKFFFGKGNGTFADPVIFSSAIDYFDQLYADDTNQDTYPDFYISQQSANKIFQVINKKDRVLEPHDLVVTNPYNSLAFGDFNRDGVRDFIAAPVQGSKIHFFKGTAPHTFQSAVAMNDEVWPRMLQVADLNRDSLLDIISTEETFVSLNFMFGRLTAPPPITIIPTGESCSSAIQTTPLAPANLMGWWADNYNRLEWIDNSINEIGFEIERSIDGTNFTLLDSLIYNSNDYNDHQRMAGLIYWYRIKAYNTFGVSAYSNIIKISPPVIVETLTALTAQLIGPDVQLSWTDHSNNELGFILERQVEDGSFKLLAFVGANVTMAIDSLIEEGKHYGYRVYAYHDNGISHYSNVALIDVPYTLPLAPQQLTAELATAHSIKLKWFDLATNETNYTIERKVGGGDFTVMATVNAGTTVHLDIPVTEGETYTYRVSASNPAGNSEYSNTDSVPVPYTIPAAPTDLHAELSTTSVSLAWLDHAFNEFGFVIERSVDGEPFVIMDTVAANVLMFVDSQIQLDNHYTYRVKAFNTAGESDYSNTATLYIPIPVPNAPVNLTGEFVFPGINLTWQDNAPDETGFIIEERLANGSFIAIDSVEANVVSYTDTIWTAGTTYEYRVAAYNDGGKSVYSNRVSVTTPVNHLKSPAPLTAYVTGKTVHVSWEDPNGNEDGFVLERAINFGEFEVLDSIKSNKTKYEDATVEFGYIYSYRIYAFNNAGISDYSNEANVLVISPPYPNPSPDKACIELPLAPEVQFTVLIFNSVGSPVPSDKYTITGAVVCINIAELSDGIYYLSVSMGEHKLLYKIIKGSSQH